MLAISFFQNSICKSMTFRIDYFHEDFSGLTRFCLSAGPAERRYLLLIQKDIYRQRVKNASQFCIKPKNLRFSFLRICQQLHMVLDTRSCTSYDYGKQAHVSERLILAGYSPSIITHYNKM